MALNKERCDERAFGAGEKLGRGECARSDNAGHFPIDDSPAGRFAGLFGQRDAMTSVEQLAEIAVRRVIGDAGHRYPISAPHLS